MSSQEISSTSASSQSQAPNISDTWRRYQLPWQGKIVDVTFSQERDMHLGNIGNDKMDLKVVNDFLSMLARFQIGSFGIGDTSNIQRRLIDHMEDVDVVDFIRYSHDIETGSKLDNNSHFTIAVYSHKDLKDDSEKLNQAASVHLYEEKRNTGKLCGYAIVGKNNKQTAKYLRGLQQLY